jgi:hypothetical protein
MFLLLFSDVQQDLVEVEEVVNNKISNLQMEFNSSLGQTNQGQMLSKIYLLLMLGQNKQSVYC